MVSNMTKQNSSIDNLVEEKENSTNELKKLENSLKNQFSEVSDKLNGHDSEINLLKVELNKFKEIFEKTKEYLLLEFESNLDKSKQIQIESENKYNDLLIYLKNENTANSLSLTENTKYKQIIEENEELIKTLENKELELNNILHDLNEKISKLSKCIEHKDVKITDLSDEVGSLKEHIVEKDELISSLNGRIEEIVGLDKNKDNQISILSEELNDLKNYITERDNENKILVDENNLIKKTINEKNNQLDSFKEEISNNQLEIKYLKNNSFTKRILNPIAYLYLILKSNPKEISLNLKLYRAIKDSECFDIGFYLNNNKDLIQSKWCKYFSPELHYVCKGFSEKRKFNKKYFNRNSKKELLDYILSCGK